IFGRRFSWGFRLLGLAVFLGARGWLFSLGLRASFPTFASFRTAASLFSARTAIAVASTVSAFRFGRLRERIDAFHTDLQGRVYFAVEAQFHVMVTQRFD